jgi:methyl-accepting chemotaxis protein
MKKIKLWGIKSKLVVYFSTLILLSSIALGYISVQKSSDVVAKEAEESLSSLTEEAIKLTQSRIELKLRTLEMLSFMHGMNSMDWNEQQSILIEQLKNTGFMDIAVVQPDGNAYYSDGTISQLGDREYVINALNGEKNVSDVIISRVTNSAVLMYAVPIVRDGKIVGALIGRSDGNALSEITDDTGFGESGYGYIISDNGTIVGHPDRDKVMNQFNPIEEAKSDESLKSLSDLFQKAIEEKTGICNYTFDGKDLYAGYSPIQGTKWIFFITAEKDEVLSAIPELVYAIVRILILTLTVSTFIAFLIGNTIANPIVKVIGYSKKIADLDITDDISKKYLKRKDEIGDLAGAMQSIIDSLRSIIKEITNTSEQLLASSEELTAASQQSAVAAEQISQTVAEVSKGAADQAQSTEEGSSKAYSLGEIIENDQLHMKNLNDGSNKVAEVVEEGLKVIDKLYKITEESNLATNDIKEVIMKTNDSSAKIGQASSVIATIAQQTNLLALNAAIEAARAGNAGRGFAVVAEEIKNLAQQSASSTKEIDEIVSELRSNTQNAVKTMEKVTAISVEQTNSVIDSRDKYQVISEAMKETVETVKQLNEAGAEMEGMKNQILITMENLSAIAEENSAATQEATASIEEQAASASEIAGSSEGLSSIAQNLQDIITKFKI